MLSKLKFFKDETGQSTVIFALVFVVLCAITAMVVDLSSVMLQKQKLQNAIDSASLAAAKDLPDTVKATATAKHYIQLNGFDPADITIVFKNSNNTIQITGSKEVSYTFAKIVGFSGTTVHPGAAASKQTMSGPFKYALFSGSLNTPLNMNGSSLYVGGDIQSNYQYTVNGSSVTVTGAVKAVNTLTLNGSAINVGGPVQGSSIVIYGDVHTGTKTYSAAPIETMPDFSDTLKAQAQASGHYYTGNKTYNGDSITLDYPIYVDGNVTVNGSRFTGKGCIVATGSISFNGSGLTGSSNDAVCYYSKTGNIAINGSSCVINGVLYAPKGTITIFGSSVTVNGRIIADKMALYGSSYRIVSGPNDLNCLPGGSVKLTQ